VFADEYSVVSGGGDCSSIRVAASDRLTPVKGMLPAVLILAA